MISGSISPATVELASAAMLIAILIGIPTGIVSALYKDAWPDQIARVFALGGRRCRSFYTGLLLLGLLYSRLGILPGPGELSIYTSPPPHLTGMVVVDALISGRLAGPPGRPAPASRPAGVRARVRLDRGS